MEKTQLNVALGYLAILLGYLCLETPVGARFTSRQRNGSLLPLASSIREFLAHSNKAEDMAADGGQTSGSSRQSRRLEALIRRLEEGR